MKSLFSVSHSDIASKGYLNHYLFRIGWEISYFWQSLWILWIAGLQLFSKTLNQIQITFWLMHAQCNLIKWSRYLARSYILWIKVLICKSRCLNILSITTSCSVWGYVVNNVLGLMFKGFRFGEISRRGCDNLLAWSTKGVILGS